MPAKTTFAAARLPTKFGDFRIFVWPEKRGREPAALVTRNFDPQKTVLIRVHSECMTGDAFHSLKCDCGEQKDAALRQISASGNGIFIYLRQEGRDIGLYDKVRAYGLQDNGFDTLEANVLLGHGADDREYSVVKRILDDLHVQKVVLLTNNPSKVKALRQLGIKISRRIPLTMSSNVVNRHYLDIKRRKFHHWLKKETAA